MELRTRNLGLAAYIKIKGTEFLGYREGKFIFSSEKSEEDWQAQYMNTEAYRHDVELMNLRRLINR